MDGGVSKALQETLEEFGLSDKVILMEADTLPETPNELLGEMVEENWHLHAVAVHYREFLARFKSLARWLEKHPLPGPESAFVARTLLIHDYRRVLLQDTRIPGALLPPRWPGSEAEQLTSRVYRALAPASIEYICAELEGESGLLPKQVPAFQLRFGK